MSAEDHFKIAGYLENVAKAIESLGITGGAKKLVDKIARLSPHETIKNAAQAALASS